MKSRSVDLTPPAAEGWAVTYLETDSVVLQTVNASILQRGNLGATCFAQIGIVTDVNHPEGVTATLADGYLATGHDISWQGRADLGHGTRLFIRAWSGTTSQIRLTAGYRMP